MNFEGISLGVMIGVISGFVLLLLLKTANQVSNPIRDIPLIIAEILAIPTFWFGGPWLTTYIMGNINIAQILPPYMSSLAITFVAIAILPLTKLVVCIGNDIGKMNVVSDVK